MIEQEQTLQSSDNAPSWKMVAEMQAEAIRAIEGKHRLVVSDNGKPFSIVYEPLTEGLIIDGIRCSVEAFRWMFVAPREDVKLTFKRDGDDLRVTQEPLT